MKSYVIYSFTLHGIVLLFLVVVGTLMSKPRMSYYSIDLMSSLPSGGGGVQAEAPPKDTVKAASTIQTPKAKPAPVRNTTPVRPAATEAEPADDTLQMLAKLKKKRLAQTSAAQSYQEPSHERPGDSQETPRESGGGEVGRGGPGMLGGGPGIVADAGTPFPFPWYLKAIADRLDKQWRPPESFDDGTMCQVSFIIGRSGQVSDTRISKSSRDSLFDQLALRAVLAANPMPPLPGGFPEDQLKVHMKFVGKR